MVLQPTKCKPKRVRRTHPDEPIVKADQKERMYWKALEIVPEGPKHSAKEKMECILAFAETGSMKEVEKLRREAGLREIPYHTLKSWTYKEWFKIALEEVKQYINLELDGKFTHLINRMATEIKDRLENGDEKVTKDGDIVKVKPGLKDVSQSLAMVFDKRNLTRGKATQIMERPVSEQQALQFIADKFEQITRRQSEKVIEGTVERFPEQEVEENNG